MASRRDLVKELLVLAGEDAVAAAAMLDVGVVTDRIVGFHAQQAVEKALKAVLAVREVEFPFDCERAARYDSGVHRRDGGGVELGVQVAVRGREARVAVEVADRDQVDVISGRSSVQAASSGCQGSCRGSARLPVTRLSPASFR